MNRAIALLIIGLIFGGGFGFTLAAVSDATLDGHAHGQGSSIQGTVVAHAAGDQGGHQAMGHDHDELLSLPQSADAPTLDVDIKADPLSGWNLHIQTTGFRFSPENASLDHVAGEGHAHVYVNGEKLGRYYSPWVHLDKLPNGPVRIEVTLNANDHRKLAVAEKPLSAKIDLP